MATSPSSIKYQTYLLIGAPGSGKGTQGKVLGTVPRFFHFACGDVFRSLDTRTPLGKAFMEYSIRGELVPDEITIELWRARIKDEVQSHEFKPDIDFLILDGIPRSLLQAELMEDLIDVRRIFHLSCPVRERLVERMRKRAIKENRLDDANEQTILQRLKTYEEEAMPLLKYYGADRVKEIDATQPPLYVLSEILEELKRDGAGLMPEQLRAG